MKHTAYAVLHVKAIDEVQRSIVGVASTPTPDRVGDILEPLGASFAKEIPLLLYHDGQRPVGIARLKKTPDGITFTATLPEILEPGTLRERVAEAWQSLQAKLIRGVSVGFRVLEDGVELLRTGGIRFLKFEILELSLVSVPANVEATITEIKALCLAAPGTGSAALPQSAGVSAVPATGARKGASRMAKTITEQIKEFEATRAAKAARMAELMTAAGEKGETLDQTGSEEYDELADQVKSIDAHLKRLADMEVVQKASAAPVRGGTPYDAQASRDRAVISIKAPDLPPGIAFTRVVLCKAAAFLALQRGEIKSALDFARERYPSDDRIIHALKAAVPPATTTDPAWAGVLIDPTNVAGEFAEFLRPQTIVGKFGTNGIPPLHRVPFNIRFIGETADGDAYWVGQGKPKPLTKFAYQATTLGFSKLATITVITQETARFSTPSAEMLARNGLARAITRRMDIDFIDPAKAAVANVSPASITNGVAPISSTGNDAAAVRADLAALLGAYIASNQNVGSLVLIMPNTLTLATSLMRSDLGTKEFPDMTIAGGTLEGIPVIASQYAAIAGNIVVAVNADEVLLADDGQVTVDASTEASLEMSSTPTQDGAAGTGAELVSLWQNNLLGLLAERYVNWQKRRPEAVAYLAGVSWGQPVGSP
jgi:HK97 family phage prohead protease/HK97 family phage major capsid protein